MDFLFIKNLNMVQSQEMDLKSTWLLNHLSPCNGQAYSRILEPSTYKFHIARLKVFLVPFWSLITMQIDNQITRKYSENSKAFLGISSPKG